MLVHSQTPPLLPFDACISATPERFHHSALSQPPSQQQYHYYGTPPRLVNQISLGRLPISPIAIQDPGSQEPLDGGTSVEPFKEPRTLGPMGAMEMANMENIDWEHMALGASHRTGQD